MKGRMLEEADGGRMSVSHTQSLETMQDSSAFLNL